MVFGGLAAFRVVRASARPVSDAAEGRERRAGSKRDGIRRVVVPKSVVVTVFAIHGFRGGGRARVRGDVSGCAFGCGLTCKADEDGTRCVWRVEASDGVRVWTEENTRCRGRGEMVARMWPGKRLKWGKPKK